MPVNGNLNGESRSCIGRKTTGWIDEKSGLEDKYQQEIITAEDLEEQDSSPSEREKKTVGGSGHKRALSKGNYGKIRMIRGST